VSVPCWSGLRLTVVENVDVATGCSVGNADAVALAGREVAAPLALAKGASHGNPDTAIVQCAYNDTVDSVVDHTDDCSRHPALNDR
jgi:ApbE superfamily uncharacterized protein (UPF0280 family)